MKLNITVDMDWIGEGESVESRIIESIALEILKSQDSTINRAVHDEVDRLIREKIDQKMEALLTERLAKGVQPTNEWGEPKGEPRPFSAVIMDRMGEYLNEHVDSDGRKASSYNEKQYPSRLEKAIAAVSKECVDKTVYEMQTRIKKEFDESTKNKILNEVTQAVIKTLKAA
jgi:hypothetical protein